MENNISPDKLTEFLRSSNNFGKYTSLISSDGKYFAAFKHIYDKKPNLVLEYGGGQSTWILQLFINELNYGGVIHSFESEKKYYDYHVESGYNEFNNIHFTESIVIGNGFEYKHDLETYNDVEFIILDGPDYNLYTECTYCLNLQRYVELLGKEIPYFIDGREGDVYHNETTLGYVSEIKDVKGKNDELYSLKKIYE